VDEFAEMAYALGMLTPLSSLLLGAVLTGPPFSLEPLPLRDGEFSMVDDSPWVKTASVRFAPAPSEEVDRSIEWFEGSAAALEEGSLSQAIIAKDGSSVLAQPGDRFQVSFGFGGSGSAERSVVVSLLGRDGVVLVESVPILPKGARAKAVYRHFVDLVVPGDAAESQPLTLAFTAAPNSSGSILLDKIAIAQVVAESEGFTPLFNGRDLDGWVGELGGYGVEDGVIRTYPKRAGGNIYTVGEYDDFIFRFRFKVQPGANNGIAIRAPLGGDAAYKGMEIQVLENSHKKYAGLKDWQYHGSVYGIAAAERGYQRPPGEWNDEEIKVDGRRVTVTLNGHVITDIDLDEAMANGTLSGKDHPGAARREGHIGFCGHGDLVYYHDLRIRPIVHED
jgi:hypothetical protein